MTNLGVKWQFGEWNKSENAKKEVNIKSATYGWVYRIFVLWGCQIGYIWYTYAIIQVFLAYRPYHFLVNNGTGKLCITTAIFTAINLLDSKQANESSEQERSADDKESEDRSQNEAG